MGLVYVVKRLTGYAIIVMMVAWPTFFIREWWIESRACDGHPCGLWQDVVRKSPHKPRGHINLGQAYMRKGRLDDALASYQQAELVSLESGISDHDREVTDLLATSNIAAIFSKRGQVEESHQILKAGWLRHPGFPGFAVNLSAFYLKNGEPLKAVAVLNEGIDSGLREYPWFTSKGLLYFHRGIAWQALKECDLAQADYATARKFPEDIPAVIECEAP